MSWDGMYPKGLKCEKCGKTLNEDGGHPAELYAGTFTGLCYGCERQGPYLVATFKIDGCQVISYPPDCPSHRRDRTEKYAYPDCEECQGAGRLYVSRSFAQGGSYYRYCRACLDRFCKQPLRAAYEKEWDVACKNIVYPEQDRLNREFGKALPDELKGRGFIDLSQTQAEEYKAIAAPFLEQFKAVRDKTHGEIYNKYKAAYEKE